VVTHSHWPLVNWVIRPQPPPMLTWPLQEIGPAGPPSNPTGSSQMANKKGLTQSQNFMLAKNAP